MSTWLDDISDPALRQCWRIVGNQDRASLRNMVRALEMMPFMNTAEDQRRLEAAKFILTYPKRRPLRDRS